MKKSYIIALVVAIVAVLWVLSGALFSSSDQAGAAIPPKEEAKKLLEVRVRTIKAESFTSDVVVTGRSYASRQVELKAETEGQVTEIVAEKGTSVTEEQVIARLEKRDREARVAEAQERLTQREIEYNAAKKLQDKGFNSKVKLAQSAADLEQARAELKKAKIDLDNTKIRAPFDGIIFEQMIEVGDYVKSGDVLFNIVDLDPVEIRGFVTEQQVGQIRTSNKAKAVFIDGTVIEGTVTYIAPAVNPQTRTFEVEIVMPNSDSKIVDGRTVQLAIPTQEKQAHKISPSVLSLDDEGRVGVKIVDQDEKVSFVPVTIISHKPDHMLVDGLPQQVRLITVGQDFVSEGQAVTPVEADGDGLL